MTLVGGSGFDSLKVIRREASRILAAGSTRSQDLSTLNPWQASFGGEEDGLVAEWTLNGVRAWVPSRVTYSGGPGVDRYSAMCVVGNTAVGGATAAYTPGTGVFLLGDSGGNLWFTGANLDLTRPRSRRHPASGTESVSGCHLSGWDIIAAGTTTSRDFPVKAGQQMTYGGGDSDGFVAALDPAGELIWASFAGGTGRDGVLHVGPEAESRLSTGGLLLAGFTDSPEFPVEDGRDRVAQEVEGQRGGEEGFVLRMRRATVSAPDVVLGHQLQFQLPLSGVAEAGANGIVTVRSLSPEKLVVSEAADADGSASVTVVNVEFGVQQPVWLQALAGEGEAVVSIRGRDYPERLVRIRLTASRLDTVPGQSFLEVPRQEVPLSVTARAVAVDPDESTAVIPQPLRPGLAGRILWESSNPAVATSIPRTDAEAEARARGVNSYGGNFSLRGAGSAELRAVLDGVPSGNTVYRVEIGARRLPVPSIVVGHNLRAFIRVDAPADVRFRVTSEDPSRVMLARQEFDATRLASLEGVDLRSGFHVDALSGEGEVTVLIEGGGYRERMAVRVAPLRVEFSDVAGTGRYVAGDLVRFWLSLLPARAALRNAPGFIAPPQMVSFASPLVRRLTVDFFRLPTGAAIATIHYISYRLDCSVRQMPVGVSQIGFGPIPEATEVAEPWTLEVLAPQGPATRGVLVAEGMGTVLDLAGLRMSDADLRQVTVSTRNPAVVRVANRRGLQQQDSVVFDLTVVGVDPGRPVIVATGAPGSTTMIDLRAPSGQAHSIPVTVGQLSAEPTFDEIRVSPVPFRLYFRFFAIDPITNRRAYGQGSVANLWPAPAPADFRVQSGSCSIAGPLRLFPMSELLEVPLDCRPGEATVVLTLHAAPEQRASISARVKIAALYPAPTTHGRPFPLRLQLGKGLQGPVSYNFSSTTPVTFVSTDPGKVLVGSDPRAPGRERVTVSSGIVYLQAVADEGVVTVLVQIQNTEPVPITVHLFPASFVLGSRQNSGPVSRILAREFDLPFVANGAGGFELEPAVFDTDTQTVIRAGLTLAGGTEPFQLRYSLVNDGVISMISAWPILEDGAGSASLSFRMQKPGTVEFALAQPPGFVDSPESRLRIRLMQTQLTSSGPLVVGHNLQIPVSLQQPGRGSFSASGQVTATSLDPGKVLLSVSPLLPGQASITFDASQRFHLQALEGEGVAQIQLQGAGIADSTLRVELVGSELSLRQTSQFEPTVEVGEAREFQVALVPVRNGVRVSDSSDQTIRAGFSVPIGVSASNPEVARVQTFAQGLVPGARDFRFSVIGVMPGQTQVRFELPAGVVDGQLAPFEMTIRGARVAPSPDRVGRGLQSRVPFVTSGRGRLRAESLDPSRLLLSFDERRTGQAVVEADLSGSSSSHALFIQGVGDVDGPAGVRLSGALFETRTVEMQVEAPVLGAVTEGGVVRMNVAGTAQLTLAAQNGTVSPGSGPLPVRLESSDPRVFTVARDAFMPVGAMRMNIPLTPVAAGRASLLYQAGGRSGSVPVEVTMGRFLLSSESRVGAGTSATMSFNMAFPAPPGGLLVRVTSLNPERVGVGQAGGLGEAEITVPVSPGQRTVSFRVDGRRAGAGSLRISAPGYEDLLQPLEVFPIVFRFDRTTMTVTAGTQAMLIVQPVATDPVTRESREVPFLELLPGSAPLRLRVVSSNPAVARVPDNIVLSSVTSNTLFVSGVASGSSRLTLTVPEPFGTVSEGTNVDVTVP